MRKVFYFIFCFQALLANDGYFIENQGQWNHKVLFLAKLKNVNVWITQEGIVYDFFQNTHKISSEDFEKPLKFQKTLFERKGHVVECKFLNNSSRFKVQALEPLTTVHHYYLGKDPQKWKTNVKLYKEIYLQQIYEGIDFRAYFQNGQFRYDFIVHPFANYQQIALQILGTDKLTLENQEPVFFTSLGKIYQKDLQVLQEKQKIQAEWKLEKNILRYVIPDYDKSKTVIIDPLLWSTFIHSTTGNDEKVTSMTRDKNFNPIITGYTTAQNLFPTTLGAYTNSSTASGMRDIFVMKLNTNTSIPIFSAFIGGDDQDIAWDIITDTSSTSSNIYITGETKSVNLPSTAGAYSPNPDINISTKSDIFIASLSSDGSSLLALTYYGGSETDVAYAMDRQSNGNIVITGVTSSVNLPMTLGTYSPSPNTNLNTNNVFVAIFNANLSSLNAATYIGGSTGENAYAITISYSDQVIIAGEAKSVDFPTIAGAHSTTSAGGNDAFASIFSSDLTTLQASTYFGGSAHEAILDISLQQSSFLATGYTSAFSTTFPTTPSCYDSTHNGGKDAFLAVFGIPPGHGNCNLLYSTYLGGSLDEEGSAVHFTTFFNIYVCGYTKSSNFPTINAFDSTINDSPMNTSWDAFIMKFPGFMPTIPDFSTFMGGSNNDLAYDIVAIRENFIFVGETQSSDYPVTTGAYQPLYNSQIEGFVTKFGICNLANLGISANPQAVCPGQSIQLNASNGFASYQWTGPNGFSSTDQNPIINNATPAMTGYYKLTATQGCTVTDSVYVWVLSDPPSVNDTTICPGNSVQYLFSSVPGANYVWYNQPTGGNPISVGINFQTSPLFTDTTFYVEIASTNCTTARDTVHIFIVNPNITSIVQSSPITVCRGNNFTVNGNTPNATTHLWYSQASGGTPLFNGNNFTINNLQNTITYYVEAIVSGCTTQRIAFQIQVPQPDDPNPVNLTICSGQDVTININYNGGTIHWFDAPAGGNLLHQGNTFTTPVLNQTTVYYVAAQVNGCYSNRAAVTVNVIPNVPAPQVQDTTICTLSPVNISLSAISNYSIIWYDAPTGGNILGTGSTINVNVNQTTTYYAEAYIPNCTSSRSALTVWIVAQPNPPLVQDTTICSGTYATIYPLSQSGNGTFLWYSQASGGNPIFTGSPFITPSLNQDTKYYVEFVVGNCTSSRVGMQVYVTPKPSDPSPIYRSNVCFGDTVQIIVAANASVLWYDSPNSNTPIHNGSFFETPNLFQNTTYYVETVLSPCTSNRIAINLNVIQVPNPTIDTLVQVCKGSYYTLFTNPPQGVNVLWYNQAQNPISNQNFLNVLVDTTKQYFVAYTTNGCTSEKVLVTLQTIPVTANANFNYDSLGQGNYIFYNHSLNGQNFVWYFEQNNSIDSIIKGDTSAVSYTFNQSGTVQVRLRAYDSNGCFDEYNMNLEVVGSQILVWVPSAFTPNDDDKNDYWQIHYQGIKSIEWYLYDRWGNLIFQSQDPNYQWDGKMNGKPCPEGVYTYLIWAKDFQEKKKKYMGTVTLIR